MDEPILRLCMSTIENKLKGTKSKFESKHPNQSPELSTRMFELNLEELNAMIISLEEIEKQLPKNKC